MVTTKRLEGCWARHGKAGVFVAALLVTGGAHAVQVNLGPVDSLALDQPRVIYALTEEPATLIGPTTAGSALLDTGANGILLAQLSYLGGEDYGRPAFAADYDGSGAIDPDEGLVQYAELGVAGTTLLDVHDVHGLRVQDSSGTQRLVNPAVRAFGDDTLNIGSFNAIVGMPAMEGYVVEVDLRPMTQPSFQEVYFHDTLSQATFESAGQLNVPLRIIPPEFTDTTLIDAGRPDLLPTFAGLPVIDNVDLFHTGGANSPGGTQSTNDRTFLVDTGAQTMIISEQMATDMGIDFVNTLALGGDVADFLEVGGIGGTKQMPLVLVDQFVMPGQGGIDIAFTDLLVGVLNIDGAPFDAVMGMNMLTTGYLAAAFGGGTGLGDSLINPLVPTKDVLQIYIDSNVITTVDDLFVDQPVIGSVLTISMEEYELLIESQILTETDDPLQAYCDVLELEEQLAVDTGATGPLFDKVVFDFTATDGTALMRLDLANPLTIPEPGTLVLMATAGVMIGWRRRQAA